MSIGQPAGQQFYCKVRIKDNDFPSPNIVSINIREWAVDILPRLELTMYEDGFLIESFPLEDNEEIFVTLARQEDSENRIELTFNLLDYAVAQAGDGDKAKLVTITGYLKNNGIFKSKSRRFKNNSSIDIFRRIAREEGIKFKNPRNVKTKDNMTWYQAGLTNYQFIRHVLQRANVINDIPFFYANVENEFVFTSLVKEMKKKESRIAKYNVDKSEYLVEDNNDKDKTIYYNSYDIVNASGYINRKIAYGASYSYYDLRKNNDGEYNDIDLMTQLSFRNKDLVGKSSYDGRGCFGAFNDNLYSENFYKAMVRNCLLKQNFFAFSISISVNAINDIRLFDKINLSFPTVLPNGTVNNEVMSGEYLVGGIVHSVAAGGIYTKLVSLHRNGMNRSSSVRFPMVDS